MAWTSHHLHLHKGENITPEYFGIHPKGLVPTLVHDGVVIIESTDIIDYLDETFPEPPLRPNNADATEEMGHWMRTAADNHIYVKTYMFANRLGKRMAKSEAELANYRELQDNEELIQFHEENSSSRRTFRERVSRATQVLTDCFAGIDRALDDHRWLVQATPSHSPISPGFHCT